jgi:hypothetical protein
MERVLPCLVAAMTLLLGEVAHAQSSPTPSDTTQVVEPAPPPTPAPSEQRVYYGGAIGFNFWGDYTRLSIEPFVGYKLKPKLSVGGRVRYEYLNDRRGAVDYDSHNYGGSVFSRYRIVPPLYAQAELAYMSFDYPGGREGVPFLLLGGGYGKPVGRNAWAYVEVLVDVLQDKNSPYEDWEPQVTVGVGVGF